jgi:hypothetical protein
MSVAKKDIEDHSFRHRVQGDSRCPCPALNAMANHGYLYVANLTLDSTFTKLVVCHLLVRGTVVTLVCSR